MPENYTLEVTQQTLRLLMLSLAAASGADMGKLAHLLAAASRQPGILPESSAMLADLAEGAGIVANAGEQRSPESPEIVKE